jgi:hypothetical protein
MDLKVKINIAKHLANFLSAKASMEREGGGKKAPGF